MVKGKWSSVDSFVKKGCVLVCAVSLVVSKYLPPRNLRLQKESSFLYIFQHNFGISVLI